MYAASFVMCKASVVRCERFLLEEGTIKVEKKKAQCYFLSEQLFAEMPWRCSHLCEFIPCHRMLTVHVLYNQISDNKTLPSARLHIIRETASGLI